MNREKIKEVIEFLDGHVDLLESNNFDELLSDRRGSIYLGAFLYDELNVEFWKYMTCVPVYMLYRSEKLTHISLPDSVTKISNDAFEECKSLRSIIIPDSVTEIDDCAFLGCTSLSSMATPSGVTRIGSNAFAFCTSLQSITIPNSVTEIGYSAFSDCTSLKSITIPNNVTEIDDLAFYNCSNLVIKVPKNSYAAEYAKENNIKYVEL